MSERANPVSIPPVVAATGGIARRLLNAFRSELDCDGVVLGRDAAAGLPETGAVDVPLIRPDGRATGRLRLSPRRNGSAVEPWRVLAVYGQILDAGLTDAGRCNVDTSQLIASIQSTIASRDVDVVYQSIVALDTGEVVGMEALSRFPQSPPSSPEQWFAEAAAAGLGDELEALAVAEALAILEQMPEGIYLSVNISPSALLSRTVLEVLDEAPAHRLVLEITEHSAVHDYDALNEALRPLRARGARVAVDDTGSGFANMRHVLRLAPDIIKLDSTLTKDIDNDTVLRALGFTLRSFAAAIGAEMIAEGIETLQELDALRFLGVAYGQGYYLEPPGEVNIREWAARGELISSRLA